MLFCVDCMDKAKKLADSEDATDDYVFDLISTYNKLRGIVKDCEGLGVPIPWHHSDKADRADGGCTFIKKEMPWERSPLTTQDVPDNIRLAVEYLEYATTQSNRDRCVDRLKEARRFIKKEINRLKDHGGEI